MSVTSQSDAENEDDIYNVEAILGHRLNKKRAGFEFLIKWEGYDNPEDNSWVSQKDCEGCDELISEYWKSIGGMPEIIKCSEPRQKQVNTRRNLSTTKASKPEYKRVSPYSPYPASNPSSSKSILTPIDIARSPTKSETKMSQPLTSSINLYDHAAPPTDISSSVTTFDTSVSIDTVKYNTTANLANDSRTRLKEINTETSQYHPIQEISQYQAVEENKVENKIVRSDSESQRETIKNFRIPFHEPSWEKYVKKIETIHRGDSGELEVYLDWFSGACTKHDAKVVYEKLPKKMCLFYESHLVFKD